MTRKAAARKSARDQLTDAQLEALTWREIIKIEMTTDEKMRFRAIMDKRAARREDSRERLSREVAPILADLEAVGLKVESVWTLVNTSEPYAQALPVLLKHLVRPYSDQIRESISRALAVRDAAFAWPVLLEEYKKQRSGRGITAKGDTEELRLGAKDGLACALGETATIETLNTLIELIRDPANGESRVLLLDSMHRRRMPHAWELIEELADDPDLKIQIGDWLKQRKKRLAKGKIKEQLNKEL